MNLIDISILKKISKHLLARKETVAVAESVTSGLIQFALSNAPDASLFFHGGITAYNIAQKYKFLQVEPIHALSVNCVSEKVAKEMAIHICKAFSGQWGIGVTGYATPSPESGNKLYAFYAIAYGDKIKKSGKILPGVNEPSVTQTIYCNKVLGNFEKIIR